MFERRQNKTDLRWSKKQTLGWQFCHSPERGIGPHCDIIKGMFPELCVLAQTFTKREASQRSKGWTYFRVHWLTGDTYYHWKTSVNLHSMGPLMKLKHCWVFRIYGYCPFKPTLIIWYMYKCRPMRFHASPFMSRPTKITLYFLCGCKCSYKAESQNMWSQSF